jgi:Cu(I)/Ag(I) efflux system membrane protein CusA/SilA
MIKRIIGFSARHRFGVVAGTLLAMLVGGYCLKHIPIDALPDLSDTQVIIYSRWERSPDLVENQLTYPLISGLLGTPKVKTIRGLSDFGFSYVYVVFDEGTDLYWARSRVLEYLSRIAPSLPTGVKTELGPDATSVGWVYQYALRDESGKLDASDLRTLQDWTLKFQLQSVPGVAEVAAVGGFRKQIQIQVDPAKLQIFHVTFAQVMKAVRDSNQESGGRVLEFSGTEGMVRSRGLVKDLSEIENSVVAFDRRTRASILVKEVAHVSWGPDMRRGVGDYDGEGDTVSGIVVMRQGEDTPQVIARVKKKIAEIAPGLPPGVKVIPVYDRSDLIHRAIDTLKHTLVEEMLIVALVILFFLWHLPSAIIPIVTLPIAVLLAFIPLFFTGQSSNIMSLAGIAISIGVLVDGAIIEVENAYRKIQHWDAAGRKEDFASVRLQALLEVGPSVFFSLLVIAVAFLPIFTLVDQEGRLFRPLAFSKTFTMAIAAILAITFDPALRMFFSRAVPFRFKREWVNRVINPLFVGHYTEEKRHPVSRTLFRAYTPVVRWTLKHWRGTLAAAGLLTLSVVPGYALLGSEFMPTLHEGTLLYMPTTLPGMSVTEARRVLESQDRILKSFPEVASVYGKAGRADTSTDAAPLSMFETTIQLKPKSAWRTKRVHLLGIPLWKTPIREEELVSEMNRKLAYPGMPNIWTMPIKNRTDMLSTGIRSPVGVKISGPDLRTNEKVAQEVEAAIRPLRGAQNVIAERTGSGTFVDIDFDRDELAIYGLSLVDAQNQAMAAIGGETVSTLLRGRERYPIQVRLDRDSRQDLESIKHVLISSPSGATMPLSMIANVRLTEGPAMIREENALPVSVVYVDVDLGERDIGSFLKDAKRAVRAKVHPPTGTFISWSGQFENMERVARRLKIVIPLTFLLIILLLHFNTRSWVKTGLVLLAVPFSMIGAVWFMWALGYHTSIATWVGMIALLGLDAETGVFMLMYLDLAYQDRVKRGEMKTPDQLVEGIVEGAVHRIRPKMMTVCALLLGLLPILGSTGAGADVMKRIAAPMIGGLVTSFILELVIYPALFFLWKSREMKAAR